MDSAILCNLLAERIGGEKFCLHGLEVRWYDPKSDTKENRNIVEFVKSEYETLASEYLAAQAKQAENAAAERRLAEIDAKTIRGLREWLVTQPTAPPAVVALEAQAIAERAKLREGDRGQ